MKLHKILAVAAIPVVAAGLTLPALSASASTVKVGLVVVNNPGGSVRVGHTFKVGVKADGSRWYLADVHGPSGRRILYEEGDASSAHWTDWKIRAARAGKYSVLYMVVYGGRIVPKRFSVAAYSAAKPTPPGSGGGGGGGAPPATAPAAITGFMAVVDNSASVTVSWDPESDWGGATTGDDYYIYQSTGDGWSLAVTIDTVNGVMPGDGPNSYTFASPDYVFLFNVAYTYEIMAGNPDAAGPASVSNTVTPYGCPPGAQAAPAC